MSQHELIALAKQIAVAHHVYPEVVCAICEQESGWDPWAMRYEPAFWVKYIAPLYASNKIIPYTNAEAYGRAWSWGLMQVMGQTAREAGFKGSYLSQLCDAPIGLEIGCQVFAHKLDISEGNVEKALLLWNGGSNRDYPAEVLARTKNYTP